MSALGYYWLCAGCFFATLVGAGGVIGIIQPGRSIMQLTREVDTEGFREVLSSKAIVERRNANLWLLIGTIVLDFALFILLLATHTPLSVDPALLVLCLLVPTIALGIGQYRIQTLSQTISQPRVFIEPFPISRGVPLQIRVSVQARRPLSHLHVRAWILCTETSVIFLRRQNLAVRRNVVEYVAADRDGSNIAAGDQLSINTRITISTGTPPSGSATVEGFPNYRWIVHLQLVGSLKYSVDFPLEVG
jgi:hypothetical protein